MAERLRIAATGFVEAGAGSIASANAVLLREWLAAGCEVDFFSKATFVDPRPAVGGALGFFDVRNEPADFVRRAVERVPLAGLVASRWDSATYHRALVAAIRAAHRRQRYDVCVWLGDYARGRVEGLPAVSFAQGPPGTDARSMLRHFRLIRQTGGLLTALKLALLARLRLSAGLPRFGFSDRIVVGSSQSRETLVRMYGVARARVASVPYAVEAAGFPEVPRGRVPGPFTVLWLGRIVPRKRLDLFLEGAAQAVAAGCDVRVIVVGAPGYVPEQARWIEAFPGRIEWIRSVPRSGVPAIFARSHVLVQPSEEEDFGSSVAEAQVSGLPVIVGATNGNRDYLGPHDVVLADAKPSTLAEALGRMAGAWSEDWIAENRRHALTCFDPARVAANFLEEIRTVVRR